MLEDWNNAFVGLTLHHPNPVVVVSLSTVQRGHHLKIMFRLTNLVDSQTFEPMENFEYYFYASQWPGIVKARLWILSAWALLMEHEALESTRLDGEQFADPHKSDWCAAHRVALERRHDMNYMISRICG